MSRKIERLPSKDVLKKVFLTDDGVRFVVLDGEYYPESAIAQQHRKYCIALREGTLVSLSFRGYAVPVLRVTEGVFRITRVLLCDAEQEVGSTSTKVSGVLGVAETRQPMGLYPASH